MTERLQQILRTVRRDPSRAELTRLDLNDLLEGHGPHLGRPGPREVEADADLHRRPRNRCRSTATSRTCSRPSRTCCSTPGTRPSRCGTICATRPGATRNLSADDRRKALIDAAGWRGRGRAARLARRPMPARAGSDRQRHRHDAGSPRALHADALHDQARQRPVRRLQRRHGAWACRSRWWSWSTTGRRWRSTRRR